MCLTTGPTAFHRRLCSTGHFRKMQNIEICPLEVHAWLRALAKKPSKRVWAENKNKVIIRKISEHK